MPLIGSTAAGPFVDDLRTWQVYLQFLHLFVRFYTPDLFLEEG